MQKALHIVLIALIALALPAWNFPAVSAQDCPPNQPFFVHGSVTLNGQSLPAGSQVSAWLDGEKIAFADTAMSGGVSTYALDVPCPCSQGASVIGSDNVILIKAEIDGRLFPVGHPVTRVSGGDDEINLTFANNFLPLINK